MKRKITSVFLALALALSLLPTAAFAAEPGQEPDPQRQEMETPQDPPVPEEEGDLPAEKGDAPEGSALQDSEGVLSEGYPSPALDGEEDPEEESGLNAADEAEQDTGTETVTVKFVPGIPGVSGQSGPRRARSMAPREAPAYSKQFFGSQLGDGSAAKAVYDALVAQYIPGGAVKADADTTVDLSALAGKAPTTTDCYNAMSAFDRDYSEVYWLGSATLSTINNVVSQIDFKMQAPWTSGTIESIDSKVQDLVATASGLDSDYLKVKQVHDWLVDHNVYNSKAADTPNYDDTDSRPWDAISALDDGLSPVCEGYARAFKLVCEKLNIPCVLVSGDGHMWNYVQIDGAWYLLDATWDDPTFTGSDMQALYHNHFLTNGTNETNEHKPDTIFMKDSGGNPISNSFEYPTLGGNDYNEESLFGGASLVVSDITASKPDNGIYEVPENGEVKITLQAKLSDDSTLPAAGRVAWSENALLPDGITRETQGCDKLILTIPYSASLPKGTQYTQLGINASFGRTIKADAFPVKYRAGAAAPEVTFKNVRISGIINDFRIPEAGYPQTIVPETLTFNVTGSDDNPLTGLALQNVHIRCTVTKDNAPAEGILILKEKAVTASSNQKEITLSIEDANVTAGTYRLKFEWYTDVDGPYTAAEGGEYDFTAKKFGNNDVKWPTSDEILNFHKEKPGLQITYPTSLYNILVSMPAIGLNNIWFNRGTMQTTWDGVSGTLTLKDENPDKIFPKPDEAYTYTVVFTSGNGGYIREKEYTLPAGTVKARTINLKIADASMTYGETLPAFSYTASPALPEGTKLELEYKVTNEDGSPTTTDPLLPGTYKITGTVKDPAPAGYKITVTPGTLTVAQTTATLSLTGSTTVSAADLQKANDANDLSKLTGLPTKVNVTYAGAILTAPTEISGDGSIAWSCEDGSVAAALSTLTGDNAPASATANLTATVTIPEDISKIANVASNKLVYPITVTGKEIAKIIPESDINYFYDGTPPDEPVFTVKDSASNLLPTNANQLTYHFENEEGETIDPPKDAGSYKLVAIYDSETHYGTCEQPVIIRKLAATLTWAGADTRTYDGNPSLVTATVSNKVGNDDVNVLVSGNTEKDAGIHTATATNLTGKASGNYALPSTGRSQSYTINKATRSVTPASLVLLPGSLSGTLTVDGPVDADAKALTLAFKSGVDNTIVSLNSSTGVVTALKNGKTTLVASAAETTNYQAIHAEVEVTAVVTPVTGATATGDTGDHLVAALDGTTVKVTGLAADKSKIAVTLTLADGLGLSQAPGADGSITVKLSDGTVIGTYAVNTEGVNEVPSGVTIQAGTNPKPTVDDTIPAENQSAATAAAENLNPEAPDLTGAASKDLVDAGKAAATIKGEDVIVETKLVVTVTDYVPTGTEKALKLEIAPEYTIKVKNDSTVIKTEKITSLAAPIAITVVIPDNFFTNMANVYVRHHLSSGGTEILKPTWSGNKLSWFQKSFSPVDLYEDARSATVTFKGGTTQTIVYTPDMIGQALPSSGNAKGWSYGGKTYTTMTEELLTAISKDGNTAELTPAADTPVTPGKPTTPTTPTTPGTPSGGGSSSSSGSSTPGTIYTSSSSSGGSYRVSSKQPSNGTVSLSSASARPGATVTISPKPSQGYELDTLTVLDKDGNRVSLQEKDGKYTFTMPKGNVTVEATFRPAGASETPADRPFGDVPDGYWADSAIRWASQNGYMNGTSATTFNPDGTITRQQMWMILARLNGQNPDGFAGARAWAMESGVSDGSNGGSPMSRQQMVTFLYRYGQLMGYALTGSADLGGFPDSAGVSGYAREPLAWATANGIVTGTAQGTLNPGGTATRAQFAVILQRFCQNVAEA